MMFTICCISTYYFCSGTIILPYITENFERDFNFQALQCAIFILDKLFDVNVTTMNIMCFTKKKLKAFFDKNRTKIEGS